MKDDIIMRILSQYEDKAMKKALKDTKELNKEVQYNYNSIMKSGNLLSKKGTLPVQQGFYDINKVLDSTMTKTEQMSKHLKRIQKPFAGYAMSIMFAGMAIQGTFQGIAKLGINTFKEINASIEGTTTNADILDGSMKYLGYTIGSALEPLLGFLIPIIDKFSEWVDDNPKTVASITAIGIALGAIFAVGGAGKLAYDGFVNLYNMLSTSDWAGVGAKIQRGIGVISITYGFVEAVGAIDKLAKGETWQGAVSAMQSGLFMAGGGMLLKGKKGGGALILIGIGLELVEKGKFFQTLGMVIAPLSAYFDTAIRSIEHNFKEGIWNGIVGTLLDIIKWISENNVISQILGLAGVDVKKIANIDAMKERVLGINKFDFESKYKELLPQYKDMYKRWDEGLSETLEGINQNTSLSRREMDRDTLISGRATNEEARQILINEINFNGLEGQDQWQRIIDEITKVKG